jgi:hypothetical protein
MFTRLAPIAALFLCLGCAQPGDAEDGEDGQQGEPGPAGDSVVGPVGPAGADGAAGQPGAHAAPCSVYQVTDDTVVFVCPDGTTATLKSKPLPCGGKK